MRFLVEVNALGQTEAKRYGIEADSWQKALQETRKLRGDEGPISGFSIELLDDGCRAVDPMARLRYVVKKGDESLGLGALEDGPATVTNRPQASAAAAPAPQIPATKMPAVAPVSSKAPPASTPSPVSTAPRPIRSSGPGPGVSIRPSTARASAAQGAASAAAAPVGAPSSASARAAAPASSPSPSSRIPPAPITKPQVSSEDAPSKPAALKVLSRREEGPTGAVPLYYREEAVLISAGAKDQAIEAMLRHHLATVQGDLAQRPRGKYVQIAAFDAPPRDKQTRPIAVLSWKDWKGEAPTFAYPRRTGVSMTPAPVARPISVPAPASHSHAPMAYATTAALSPDALGSYAAQGQPANGPAAHVASAPAQQAPIPSAAVASAPAPPAPMPAPSPFVAANAAPAAAASTGSSPRHPGSGSIRPASSGGFPAADGTGRRRSLGDKRVPAEELIAQLFEEMHALHFLADALEGGHFCLAVAMEKLPSKAAFLHLYDIDKREFVVVCTRGVNTEALLLSRIGESDALLASAMRRRRAVVVNEASREMGTNVSRFAAVDAKRIIVTPVMQAGRFLGAIELVNPLDGGPFNEAEGNAITYMAEQYAEFVAARGVVLEPEKVSRASQAARA